MPQDDLLACPNEAGHMTFSCYIWSTQRKLADDTHLYQTCAKRDDASWYWPHTKKPTNEHQNIAKKVSSSFPVWLLDLLTCFNIPYMRDFKKGEQIYQFPRVPKIRMNLDTVPMVTPTPGRQLLRLPKTCYWPLALPLCFWFCPHSMLAQLCCQLVIPMILWYSYRNIISTQVDVVWGSFIC